MQKAFIETQFPIARLSAESYKERKANYGQTLTRLGKWWGRKPLILVRACILGMLMPASDDPKKDREIFLKILTMDDEGTWNRQKGEISVKAWREAAPAAIQDKYFGASGWQRGVSAEEKEFVIAEILGELNDAQRQRLDDQRKRPISDRHTFDGMPYAERIAECERPENVAGPSPASWAEINAHLGTKAANLPELIEQLGQRSFGHTPRVGDAFCGGGSIPFEAARIGCKAFGSDLNPVAGLLTWASLHLLGGGKDVQAEALSVQAKVLAAADKQITDWGVEHNEQGERADAYLYCVEVKPEGCEYFIPLAPTWLVGEKAKVICTWKRLPESESLQPEILAAPSNEVKAYKAGKNATISNSRVIDPFDSNRSCLLKPYVAQRDYGAGVTKMWCHVMAMCSRRGCIASAGLTAVVIDATPPLRTQIWSEKPRSLSCCVNAFQNGSVRGLTLRRQSLAVTTLTNRYASVAGPTGITCSALANSLSMAFWLNYQTR